MGFYSEAANNENKNKEIKDKEDFTKDLEEDEIAAQVSRSLVTLLSQLKFYRF